MLVSAPPSQTSIHSYFSLIKTSLILKNIQMVQVFDHKEICDLEEVKKKCFDYDREEWKCRYNRNLNLEHIYAMIKNFEKKLRNFILCYNI